MVHVKPSDVAEIAGLAVLDYAFWRVNTLTGLFFTGFALLFIGYVIEDDKALIALKTPVLTVKSALKRVKKGDK